MHDRCRSKFAGWIDALMVEDLPPQRHEQLRAHVARCDSCRARYDRAVLAGRMLEGGPAALERPSQRELDRIGAAVLQRARLVPDAQPARRSVAAWIAGLATAAVALLIAIPLALRSGPPEPGVTPAQEYAAQEQFQPRGTPGQSAGADAHRVGFRAFCIRGGRTSKASERRRPAITGIEPTAAGAAVPSCDVGSILRFAYTNRSGLRYLFLVGLDEQLRIKWYEPHPPVKESIAVAAHAVDKPLDRAVRLQINHGAGTLRLFALFSARPLSMESIEAAVARVRARKTPLERLEALPGVEGATQRSLLMKLTR